MGQPVNPQPLRKTWPVLTCPSCGRNDWRAYGYGSEAQARGGRTNHLRACSGQYPVGRASRQIQAQKLARRADAFDGLGLA